MLAWGHLPLQLFVAQLFATVTMTGITWFVQVVHYPLFALVPDPHHTPYARQHQKRTGRVVAPLMLLELATSLLALVPSLRFSFLTEANAVAGFALVAIIWLSTALLQVPLHGRLLNGIESIAVRRLVATNWLRTIAWTIRSALLIEWLLRLAW